uniref:Sulfotransferase domain-containing protein n=1 Tax=Parascaris univalens TaxID=6257 RepID=A0A915A4N8_PARUN
MHLLQDHRVTRFADERDDKANQMPQTNLSQITLEKTPAYFISKTAPERIQRLDRNMKLIVVVRNPITRAISDYTQAISKRKRSAVTQSFEAMAIRNETLNSSGNKSAVNTSWGAVRIGIYHRHIRKWLIYFPLKQIHFVDGERLITSPATEIRAVEKFLGVVPTVRPSDFAMDPVKGFPCVLRVDGTMHCLGKTKGRAHPLVRADVMQTLHDYYKPENEKFFLLVNRRFSW